MHLPDGLVPVGMAVAGYAGSGALLALSLSRIAKRPDPQAEVPRAAMMTAVFFAVSSIAVPVPPTTVHLMLSGVMGVLLGWFAVPAVLVGLFLQAVLFGHGGLTTIGLNGLIIGLPALLVYWGYRVISPHAPRVAAALAGGAGVLLSLVIFASFVLIAMPDGIDKAAERAALGVFVLAHMPLLLAEAVIVLALIRMLARVEPGLLQRG